MANHPGDQTPLSGICFQRRVDSPPQHRSIAEANHYALAPEGANQPWEMGDFQDSAACPLPAQGRSNLTSPLGAGLHHAVGIRPNAGHRRKPRAHITPFPDAHGINQACSMGLNSPLYKETQPAVCGNMVYFYG